MRDTTPTAPAPVPEPVERLLAFTNSVDNEEQTDDLTTPTELSDWLFAHHLTEHRVARDDCRPRAGPCDSATRCETPCAPTTTGSATSPRSIGCLPSSRCGSRTATTGRCLRPVDTGMRGAPGRGARRGRPGCGWRQLATAQDLRARRVPVGVLRPVEEPLPDLVRVGLRQQGEDAQLPRPATRDSPARWHWCLASPSAGRTPVRAVPGSTFFPQMRGTSAHNLAMTQPRPSSTGLPPSLSRRPRGRVATSWVVRMMPWTLATSSWCCCSSTAPRGTSASGSTPSTAPWPCSTAGSQACCSSVDAPGHLGARGDGHRVRVSSLRLPVHVAGGAPRPAVRRILRYASSWAWMPGTFASILVLPWLLRPTGSTRSSSPVPSPA